ncbi:putative membrane protein [Bhargavaea ullalensis]|uniref:Membrane protein n=1 Tax=Bhargavaea ullalensis TaxID=1265685 RepID=A0ABV2GCS8_9BACL
MPTLSTFFIALSAVLVAIGWRLITQRKIEAHKKTMLAAGVSALLFFIIYISRTVFIGNTSFGGPDSLKIYYTVFLIFHIFLATVGAVFGLISIWTGLKDVLPRHRKIGPITSIIWFFTAITGVAVYLLLYVFYKGGETTSVFRAILGY